MRNILQRLEKREFQIEGLRKITRLELLSIAFLHLL
jgi:transcriptional regulator of met regulon